MPHGEDLALLIPISAFVVIGWIVHIIVDGNRLHSPVCASLGADNETLLPKRAYAAVER